MGCDDALLQENQVAVARWADKYTARFDQALTDAWPDLADRLREQVAGLYLYDLTVGPGEAFQKERIEPAVKAWVERYVEPVIEEARDEFCTAVQSDLALVQRDLDPVGCGGVLEVTDVLKGLALPTGLLVGGGAVAAAIVTTTKLLIFTTVVVHWPLLIAGLVVGTILSLFGGGSLASLRQTFQKRFENKLVPAVKEALVGGGTDYQGKHIPSLRDQLQQQVREAARRQLEPGR
jgi:hypothetical protein